MRFSKHMLRTVVSTVFVIALISPLGSIAVKSATANENARMFNPLRGAEARIADANRIQRVYGSSILTTDPKPSVSSPTTVQPTIQPVIKPPIAEKSPIATKTIQQERVVVASKERVSTQLAIDSLGSKATTSRAKQKKVVQPLTRSARVYQQLGPKLDGAYVPPTIGRFVQTAQNWKFIPDHPGRAIMIVTESRAAASIDNTFRTASAIERLRKETENRVELEPTNPLRNRGDSTRYAFVGSSSSSESKVTRQVALNELTVTKDLALTRVIELMSRRGVANHWVVSGQVSSANGSDELRIRTAVPAVD